MRIINEHVVTFVLSDWMGKELGRYPTLDAVEERMSEIARNDAEVKALVHHIEQLEDAGESKIVIEVAELMLEEVEDGIREDLYVTGLDKYGEEMEIEFA